MSLGPDTFPDGMGRFDLWAKRGDPTLQKPGFLWIASDDAGPDVGRIGLCALVAGVLAWRELVLSEEGVSGFQNLLVDWFNTGLGPGPTTLLRAMTGPSLRVQRPGQILTLGAELLTPGTGTPFMAVGDSITYQWTLNGSVLVGSDAVIPVGDSAVTVTYPPGTYSYMAGDRLGILATAGGAFAGAPDTNAGGILTQ